MRLSRKFLEQKINFEEEGKFNPRNVRKVSFEKFLRRAKNSFLRKLEKK